MQKLVKKGKISGTESHITTLESYQSDFKLPFMKNIDTEHSSISRDILLCSVSMGKTKEFKGKSNFCRPTFNFLLISESDGVTFVV